MENTTDRTTECAICQDCLTLFANGETVSAGVRVVKTGKRYRFELV